MNRTGNSNAGWVQRLAGGGARTKSRGSPREVIIRLKHFRVNEISWRAAVSDAGRKAKREERHKEKRYDD